MINRLDKLLSVLIAAMMALSSFSFDSLHTEVVRTDTEDYIGLKTAYEDYFKIGVAGGSGTLLANKEMVLKNFNSITCENAMKVYAIHPAEDNWQFAEADAIADLCRENDLVMRGHTLVWGIAYNFKPWMLYDGDEYASSELFYARLKDHITTIINRYDDVVYCWDVVNEALHYNRTAQYQDYLVFQLYGEDYAKNAFRFAAEALDAIGSDAKLFLNETKMERSTAKADNTYNFIKELQAEGIRVDGIGIQGHYDFYHPNESARRIDKNIKRFAALGLDIEITEMDITVYDDILPDVKYDTLPEWRETYQRERYEKIFKVFRDNADVITNVTFWGLNDAVSYRSSGNDRADWPLLFDINSEPKSNFYAVTDFYFTQDVK
jgi:GH35 family endo-1,4-beta-xylanase